MRLSAKLAHMKTRNLLILSAVVLALIVGAAAWQLSSGNLFGSDIRRGDTTVATTATSSAPPDSAPPDSVPPDSAPPDSAPPDTVPTAATPTDSAPTGGPTTDGGLEVRGNGIGAFTFGAPADKVIAAMTARFGAPGDDTGWEPQPTPCDEMGVDNRSITWGWITLTFSNGPTRYAPAETNHLMSVSLYDPGDSTPVPDVRASDGEALIGTTLAELQARIAGTTGFDNEITGPSFSTPDGLEGGLEPPTQFDPASTVNPSSTVDPAGVIRSLRAGNVCID